MRALMFPLVLVSLLVPNVHAGPLNDTGIDFCRDHATGADTAVTPSTTCTTAQGGQDARYGRDPAVQRGAMTKIGGGSKGFDFTKVCNSGQLAGQGTCPANPALGSGNDQWACTKDNNTGLIWEVKTSDGGLRDRNNTYTNYDDPTRPQKWNGGAYVNPTQAEIDAPTNSIGFVNAVNALVGANRLCGATDWRRPTVDELSNIADIGIAWPGPTIDATYFPNTPASHFWSGSPVAGSSGYAWNVGFDDGFDYWYDRLLALQVRLVRAGQ
jgi:hypothetical protein